MGAIQKISILGIRVLLMAVLFVSVLAFSDSFTDQYIVPKWSCTICVVSLFLLALSLFFVFYSEVKLKILFVKGLLSCTIVILSIVEATWGILQFLKVLPTVGIGISGTFDNAAGFASMLSIGFAFSIMVVKRRTPLIRYLATFALPVICMALFAAQSRAGIISVLAVLLFCYWNRVKCIWWKISIVIMTLFILVLLYGMKKDSADGRILIWKCAANMISDAPVTGHGAGAFSRKYMDYQKTYFLRNADSEYGILADNVRHPFNELILFIINFGVIGMLMLLLFVCMLCYFYKKLRFLKMECIVTPFIPIAIFSMFSYPFTYPFTWIVVAFLMCSIFISQMQCAVQKRYTRYIFCALGICLSLYSLYKTYHRVDMEMRWNNAISYSKGKCGAVISKMQGLYHYFSKNPYFLYNYAVMLFENKDYDKSLDVALQCRKYWADYDLELLIGELYQKCGNYELAEHYYQSAFLMIPSRFLPLYQLFHLYKFTGEELKKDSVANIVIHKKIKINSPIINKIVNEVKSEM